MKNLIALIASVALAAVSCQKEGQPGETQADPVITQTGWNVSTAIAANYENKWTYENEFMAQWGTYADSAIISTSRGTEASAMKREVYGSHICAVNLSAGDAFVFTLPRVNLAAGSTVDFMFNFYAASVKCPKYWIFEYYEDGKWKTVDEDLHTAAEDKSIRYSCALTYYNELYTTFIQSFRLNEAIDGGKLVMRCKVAGSIACDGTALVPDETARVALANSYWMAAHIDTYQGIPQKDKKKLLVIGNSFTVHFGSTFTLKELARSQGHELSIRASMKNGIYFSDFLSYPATLDCIAEGGYDIALLQEASMQYANYQADPVANAKVLADSRSMVEKVKAASPSARIVLERTWSYSYNNCAGFGSIEAFDDALAKGTARVCDSLKAEMSPIGEAFNNAKSAGITALYRSDNHHQSRNGSYLKACVDYLVLYGEPFDANAANCFLDAELAAKLRRIAEETVLGY